MKLYDCTNFLPNYIGLVLGRGLYVKTRSGKPDKANY